mgnify:CR=1 FL=1
MIFYKNYQPNRELYIESLIGMLRELKGRNQLDKLRTEIIKYFVDEKSQFYEADPKLRARVKQLGGSVIE